ncbi:MAG: hypothetical protein AAGD92_09180 [Pseudomonadota bacterium]
MMIASLIYIYWLGAAIHDQPDRESLVAIIWRLVGFGVVSIPLLIVRQGVSSTPLRTAHAAVGA